MKFMFYSALACTALVSFGVSAQLDQGSLYLPPKTYSGVCPAIEFDQGWKEINGRYYVRFTPRDANLPFKFVDMHVSLEANGREELLGKVRNYAMLPTAEYADAFNEGFGGEAFSPQQNAYVLELQDPEHIAALRQPRDDASLKYSFTYCVGVGGKPVDCDTEAFSIVSFKFRESLVECPTQCGLSASAIDKPVSCIGSDGNTYPAEHCAHLPRSAPLMCPATPACMTFNWREQLLECPTSCGLGASTLVSPASCVGSDGNIYEDYKCANMPRPTPMQCPATPACVTFNWREQLLECPTSCGLGASTLVSPASCVGSDGNIYADYKCAQFPRTTLSCSPTAPCITYAWRQGLGECPTECDMPATYIEPAVSCMGSDGREVDGSFCNQGGRPQPILCPATKVCPLSPYCHPIEFDQRVQRLPNGGLEVIFAPAPEVQKHQLEWVDLHMQLEDAEGNVIALGNESQRNVRMTKDASSFTYKHTLSAPSPAAQALLRGGGGRRLAYSFTYCVDMIDCDPCSP